MKSNLKNFLLAFAGITTSTHTTMASVPFVAGDIGIAFYAYTDSVVEPDTYVVNLGQASLYRENTQSGVAVSTINPLVASSNISADLVATFGDDWADGGRVRWAVVGGVSSTGPATSGDPVRTSYFSVARTSLATGATGPGTTIIPITSTNRGFISTNIAGFVTSTNNGIGFVNADTSTPGANLAGVILPTTNINTFDKYVPPVINGLFFGQSVDPRQTFATGPISGGAGVEGALDIYRILHSTSNADLTAGASSGNAVVGVGQFIGTLTIDSAGNLKIVAVGAANPDSDNDGLPDAWEIANFGNLAQTTAGDYDNDGTNNLTEYRLGIDPKSGTSRFSATRGSNGILQWPNAVGVTFIVQRSTTLSGSWTTIATIPGTAGSATYTDPAPPAGHAFYRVGLQP